MNIRVSVSLQSRTGIQYFMIVFTEHPALRMSSECTQRPQRKLMPTNSPSSLREPSTKWLMVWVIRLYICLSKWNGHHLVFCYRFSFVFFRSTNKGFMTVLFVALLLMSGANIRPLILLPWFWSNCPWHG